MPWGPHPPGHRFRIVTEWVVDCSAANRLEVLLDRALERGSFLLLSQLHVTIH